MFVPYFFLNLWFPAPWVVYVTGLGIAVSAAWLVCAGSREVCLLRWSRPSLLTLVVLATGLIGSIPVVMAMDRLQPHTGGDIVGRAIASGFSQELYFRGAVFGVLRSRNGWTLRRAILGQAALFGVWHARGFVVVDPLEAWSLLIFSVAAGVIAALLALRDRTIAWVAAAHTVFLTFQ